MKRTTTKKLLALALTTGILLTGTLGASAAEWVSPIDIAATGIVESKQETIAGIPQPQMVHTVKPGTAITVTQNKSYDQTIVALRVWELDNPENLFVFYNREVWPTTKVAPIDPVTVKFEKLQDATGASFDMAKPGQLYLLAVDVLDMSDPANPDGSFYGGYCRAYFRIEGEAAPAPAAPAAPTAPVDPATLPPHGDPIYRPGPHDGPEVGPFGNIPGYIYIPGYGYVKDEGGGAINLGGNPDGVHNLSGVKIGHMG